MITPGLINPVAAKYAAMYPEPNQPGTAGGTAANYFTNMLRPYDYNAILGARRSQLLVRATGCS